MASINRSRNAEFVRVADDDPFAELTRIVGQNPIAGDRSHAANDPLGLDMENELMGNLARFERPAPAVPAHEPVEDVEPASDADDFDLAMDAEFEAAFEDDWDIEATTSATGGTPEMQHAIEPEAQDVPPAPAWNDGPETQVSEQAADVGDKPHLFDRIEAELRANESVRTGIVETDQARTLSDEEITAFAAEWEEQSRAPEQDDAGTATQNASPETLFASNGAEQPAFAQEPLSFLQNAEPEGPSAEEAGTPAFSMDMPDLLLDSDLETAFADGEGEREAGSGAEDDVPFDYDRAAADRHVYLEQVLDDSLPDTFGEADVAPLGEADASTQAEEAAAYIPLSKPDEAAQPAPSTGSIMRDAVISTFATVPFWGKTRQEQPAPRQDEDAAAPEAPPAVETFHAGPAMPVEGPALEDEAAALEDAGRPQVDTIDIEDRAAAVVDDLDIPEPELPPEPIADSEFHELAAELAGAFGEMTDEALAEPETMVSEPQQTATAFAGQQYLFEQPDADHASALPAQEQYQFETAAAAGFDAPFEPTGREDFNAWAGGMDDEDAAVAPAPRRAPLLARFGRRGVFGAAALAGLVVIGGASVFALSAGGGGLGQPALVKASDEPFKVKPKDPGGRTVSADNNEVYQRASGNVADVPEQKALLTTTEEPLDLSKTVAPRIVDASAVIGAPSDATAAADDDWSKSQARLAPTDEAQGSDVPPALTVQARRVETFIVRPDGTLVPREPTQEEVAKVASAAPQTASDGAVMDDSSPAAEAGDETEAPAAVEAASEPEAETAAPAENTEPTAVASNAPAAEKPALAPAATKAASDWSVQISSQPTPEAAQESYRRMAERYGDLLAGRGVNIVKADISGKGTYYRVRIPSASKDDAIDLCTKLKGAGGNCFVSK